MSLAASLPVISPAGHDPIGERVQAALVGVQPTREVVERRRESRHPFPYPVRITPVTTKGRLMPELSLFVLGKHLSRLGMDFYHLEPVPHRRVIATLPCGASPSVSMLMDLTWCRFGAHRWYENGGKFVQALRTLTEPTDAETLGELTLL
jgi:hypothetical protein